MIGIEIEYTGPRLRGLGVMLLTALVIALVLVEIEDPYAARWEGFGFLLVVAAGFVVQLRDLVRWRREKPAGDEDESGGGGS